MRRIVRACAILAVVIAAGTLPSATLPSATGGDPEQTYIAARDAAIAKIKAMEAANTEAAKKNPSTGDDFAVIDFDKKASAALERQLRAIVGPVAIKGLDGEGAINLDTLIEGDEDFGLLDGMIFGPVDAKTRVIVTTDGLLCALAASAQGLVGQRLDRHPVEPRRRR